MSANLSIGMERAIVGERVMSLDSLAPEEAYALLEPVYEPVRPPAGADADGDWYLRLTEDDLPYSDGIPMETDRHVCQMILLKEPLRQWLRAAGSGYVAGNMFIYFSPEQVKGTYVRGPDLFVAQGVSARERKSWVVWQEHKVPELVIELLSESTARTDKGTKKLVYQDQLGVSEYYWYDPFDPEDWMGFVQKNGVFQPLERDRMGRYISPSLGLALVRWQGEYADIDATWLRWALPSGELLPTEAEAQASRAAAEKQRADAEKQRAELEARRADAETQRAELEARRADAEKQRAESLLAKLRAMGLDPDTLAGQE